ncbi:hypothetical protein [Pseudonocardia sp. D17]|uniref:hypothetical protein n=1 Tax=Pseudonocardia sp. D17 TaxID=882661 RepID=UPI002B39EDB9|nr:hypothetical protein PSD17_56340 [Pseudonocardia sp. D17]
MPWIGRDRMESYPRWQLAAIVVGLALLALPVPVVVDLVCGGFVAVAFVRALRPVRRR